MTPPSLFLAAPSSAAGEAGSSARNKEGIDAAPAASASAAARASKLMRRINTRQENLDERSMGLAIAGRGTLRRFASFQVLRFASRLVCGARAAFRGMVAKKKAALQGGVSWENARHLN